jgi:hypothetical protein
VRYFCYNEYDPESPLANEETGGYVMTKSEDEILYEYYPHWHEQMCKKFGREHVDKNYSFQDCIDDWIVVNWEWEST